MSVYFCCPLPFVTSCINYSETHQQDTRAKLGGIPPSSDIRQNCQLVSIFRSLQNQSAEPDGAGGFTESQSKSTLIQCVIKDFWNCSCCTKETLHSTVCVEVNCCNFNELTFRPKSNPVSKRLEKELYCCRWENTVVPSVSGHCVHLQVASVNVLENHLQLF